MNSPKKLIILGGLAVGLALSACAKRKAKEACEDYLDAVEECAGGAAGFASVSCSSAKGKDLDYFECLADWASDGCMEVPTCTP